MSLPAEASASDPSTTDASTPETGELEVCDLIPDIDAEDGDEELSWERLEPSTSELRGKKLKLKFNFLINY